MMKSGREYSRAYGVDLDERRLQVTIAERTRAGVTARTVVDQALGAGVLEDPAQLTSLQADLLAGTATLCAALPTANGFTRWLHTPFASRRKAVRVLPALLDIQLPFPLERCTYRFPCVEASPETGHVRGLAVAARETDMEARVARLRDLGLDPLMVEHEALALWRQHNREQPPADDGVRVLAMLGASRSALVLGKGDRFEAAFALAVGAEDLGHDAASGGSDAGGAMAQFVRRARHVLQAHAPAGGQRVDWTWTGPGAEQPRVPDHLQKSLQDQGKIDFRGGREPATFLARALATGALDQTAEPGNLRTGSLEHPASANRRQRQFLRSAAAGVVAGVLLCGVALAGPWLMNHYDTRLQARITEEAKALTGMRVVPRGQELHVVEQKLAQRREQAEVILRAVEPAASSVMEHAVTRAARSGVTLSGVTARPGFFSVKGAAPDATQAAAFEEAMQIEGFGTHLETDPAAEGDGLLFVLKGEVRDD